MSKISILSLPTELLHHIFDHCDAQTILCSIRGVCKQLYANVRTYNRFNLHFDDHVECHFEAISRLIQPERIISITATGINIIQLLEFIDLFGIDQFTRLQTLKFQTYRFRNVTVFKFVTLLLTQSSLQRLHLSNLSYIEQGISWPFSCSLKNLTLGKITFEDYHGILQNSPHLRKFSMEDCTMNNTNRVFSIAAPMQVQLVLLQFHIGLIHRLVLACIGMYNMY